ncbi:hypothetical protein BH160DRAFT_2009 [Burkholderia sp. H160]|nr:hypothetical protein BH160DRAFT_2009 [Burkholderia sp. H160]
MKVKKTCVTQRGCEMRTAITRTGPLVDRDNHAGEQV